MSLRNLIVFLSFVDVHVMRLGCRNETRFEENGQRSRRRRRPPAPAIVAALPSGTAAAWHTRADAP
jgi:hypothetical protein